MFMHSKELHLIMLKFYRITPKVISKDRIEQFLELLKSKKNYKSHVSSWRNLNKNLKMDRMIKSGWILKH